MRARVVKMIATAVTVAVLILGIPSVFLGGVLVWQSEQLNLESQTQSLGNTVERRVQNDEPVTAEMLESWLRGENQVARGFVRVNIPEKGVIKRGERQDPPRLSSSIVLPSGTTVRTEVSAWPAIWRVARIALALLAGMAASLLVGWWLALRGSRQISAPLIYLAAQAEQVGSGQVQARVKPSGIEEIDLVQEELVRTGERMAGRREAGRQVGDKPTPPRRTPQKER